MIYLGEFLSVTNKITLDSDTVTKYFYYRPERYDDHSAELENIFTLRALSGFPQIGDTLSENPNYVINNIDIAKRVDDTNTGVKNVSYVVTCTYELPTASSSKSNADKQKVKKDKNGNVVTEKTPPWYYENTFTKTPVQVEVPFIKAYDTITNLPTVDVINKAGKRLISSTTRYRFEFNVKVNSQTQLSYFENLSGCMINDANWTPITKGMTTFKEKTCLIFPTTYSKLSWQAPTSGTMPGEIYDYYEYNVKFIYDPEGWDKKLLNIGTWAKFYSDQPAEQIYSYRTKDGQNWSSLQYGDLADVERAKMDFSPSGVTFEKVNEPLPLTLSGNVDTLAITLPDLNPYEVLNFQEYPKYSFANFPTL